MTGGDATGPEPSLSFRERIRYRANRSPTLFRVYVVLNLLLSMRLKEWREPSRARLFLRVIWHTLVPHERLANTLERAERVEAEGLEGALVECGAGRGGCAAVMAQPSHRNGSPRKVWLFDSFEGLPEPTPEDGPRAELLAPGRRQGRLVPIGKPVASADDVEHLLFQKMGYPRERIVIRKGWFQQTLPASAGEIGPVAILRIDADWSASTKACLEAFFDRGVPGGFLILDDYGFWEGCRRAADAFFASRGVAPAFVRAGEAGVYLQKPRAPATAKVNRDRPDR